MYAKIIDGVFNSAPKKIKRIIDGQEYTTYNPTDEMLVAAGWMLVIETDINNEAPDGYHYEPSYTEANNQILKDWELVQDDITEETALIRYANKITGVDNCDLASTVETMIKLQMGV